jgi:hypothetical protein
MADKGRAKGRIMMVQLFRVTSRVANMHGYKNVTVNWFVAERQRQLFGTDGWLGIPYQDVIAGYRPDDEDKLYRESAVEEFFTDEEAKTFVEFVRTHRDDASALIEPAALPIKHQVGFRAMPVGGEDNFLRIGDDLDYDLLFKVFFPPWLRIR